MKKVSKAEAGRHELNCFMNIAVHCCLMTSMGFLHVFLFPPLKHLVPFLFFLSFLSLLSRCLSTIPSLSCTWKGLIVWNLSSWEGREWCAWEASSNIKSRCKCCRRVLAKGKCLRAQFFPPNSIAWFWYYSPSVHCFLLCRVCVCVEGGCCLSVLIFPSGSLNILVL